MTQKTVSVAFEDHLATLNNNKLIYEIKTSYDRLSEREKPLMAKKLNYHFIELAAEKGDTDTIKYIFTSA